MMNIIETAIKDVKIIEPKVHEDDRGFFFESFNHMHFEEVIRRKSKFVQDNHSKSTKGVLRGLNYQMPPNAQGKLVRVIIGEIFDVAVDIRTSSKTYGDWLGVPLSAENKKQIWIPEGFAHGFITLSDTAEVIYKTTSYYSPTHEHYISWNDSILSIEWPRHIRPKLSEKDQKGKAFQHSDSHF